MLADLPSLALTPAQLDALLVRLRLNEIAWRLSDAGSLGVVPVTDGGTESPEPVYDVDNGRRLNTREVRTRKRLVREQAHLVADAQMAWPGFVPPPTFEPVSLLKRRKIYMPIDKYPDYNFVGLVLGPRGNTQKRMERATGAKISIRGRGTAKGSRPMPGDNEPLHVVVSAETTKALRKAVKMVEQLMHPVADELNDHKRQQLRELALLSGTMNEEVWVAPEAAAAAKETSADATEESGVVCGLCGETSHPEVDCPAKGTPKEAELRAKREALEREYSSFMSEVAAEVEPGEAPAADEEGSVLDSEYQAFLESATTDVAATEGSGAAEEEAPSADLDDAYSAFMAEVEG